MSAAATGWSGTGRPASSTRLGLVYTFVTEHLGFAGFGDEGKVMALAAFGEDTYVERFRDVIRPTPDGGYAVNMAYFSYDAFGQLRPLRAQVRRGVRRRPRAPTSRSPTGIATSRSPCRPSPRRSSSTSCAPCSASSRSATSCMTGGVALNCVANAKILEHTDVRRIWVPPCASDTGAPLGSALWHYHQTLGQPARASS